MKKRVLIVCLLMIIIFACVNSVYGFTGGDVTSALNGGVTDAGVVNKIRGPLGVVLDVIRLVGMGIAMIMILSFGIKYMVSMPSDRAQMMKQSMIYLLGAVLLFGASFLVGFFAKVIETASKP